MSSTVSRAAAELGYDGEGLRWRSEGGIRPESCVRSRKSYWLDRLRVGKGR